ncbi:2OG-Fe dioxygenase family protein [Actinoplanes sp. NPDC051859]|uniref:2OG-Fe dioxygenase family protein n=1 Tax=Actinoplanes sp. NPDC051859 TaxID=3363909 RepID=UPI0037B08406
MTISISTPVDAGVTAHAGRAERDGFAVLRRADLAGLLSEPDLEEFRKAWEDLPVDTELAGGGTYRERRYGKLRVRVGAGGVTFEALPHATFRQDVIPLWAGRNRVFAPITPEVLEHPGMTALVGFDARLATALSGRTEWEIGVHLVRIIARRGAEGLPTPEGRHRDGHAYVGMHLVRRDGVTGGRSTIYPNDGGEPVSTTLTDPLDSVFVDDAAVTHEVTPTVPAAATGVRDMLLVDVNPPAGT